MPGPDQLIETTVVRDGMLDRMRRATPGGALFPMESAEHRYQLPDTPKPKGAVLRQRIGRDGAVIFKLDENLVARFEPVGSGAVLAAALRETAGDTLSVVENAVKPYSTVGCFGVEHADRWRSGEAYGPFEIVRAVADAIDARPISKREVEAAAAVLPGVDVELVHRALVEARTARAIGE